MPTYVWSMVARIWLRPIDENLRLWESISRPIDEQSMMVKTNQSLSMKIYDGESEMPIDVWSMVVKIWLRSINKNLWWWIWNAHRFLIYGGEN